jgi:hypothetical protein
MAISVSKRAGMAIPPEGVPPGQDEAKQPGQPTQTRRPDRPRSVLFVDAPPARYRQEKDTGRVLPNSVEAPRVEPAYHSNAIEAGTPALRESGVSLNPAGVRPSNL